MIQRVGNAPEHYYSEVVVELWENELTLLRMAILWSHIVDDNNNNIIEYHRTFRIVGYSNRFTSVI